jgi:hypothetical protein
VDRDAFPADAGVFDAIILGWGGLSLVHSRERRVRLLAEIAAHVAPDGPILVSFFQRDSDTRELRLTAGVANAIRAARRRDRVDAGDTLSPNRVHVFTKAELDAEAAAGGLQVTAFHVTGAAEVHINNAAAILTRRR